MPERGLKYTGLTGPGAPGVNEHSRYQFELSQYNTMLRREGYHLSRPGILTSSPEHIDIELEAMILDVERLLIDRLYSPKNGGLSKSARILEAGTGTGVLPRYMAECRGHEGEIVGIDISENAYLASEVARERKKSAGEPVGNVRYMEADAKEIPFEDDSFDATLLDFFLYHEQGWIQVLDEAARVTRRGGLIGVLHRGINNMSRMWGFQPRISTYLSRKYPEEYDGILAPRSYYHDVPVWHLLQELKKRFDVQENYSQSALKGFYIPFTAHDWPLYRAIVATPKDNYLRYDEEEKNFVRLVPHKGHMLEAIDAVVKPFFAAETGMSIDDLPDGNESDYAADLDSPSTREAEEVIQAQNPAGVFREDIEQIMLLCRNNKKPKARKKRAARKVGSVAVVPKG